MTGAPPIHEAVNFLDRFAPQTLRYLQAELPQLGEFATVDSLALVASTALPQAITDRAKFSLATLREVKTVCDRGIGKAQSRLTKARQLALFGSITAAVGSASVVAALATAHPTVGTALGIMSLVGSVAALLADNFTKLPNGEGSAFEVYQNLTSLKVEARILEADLSYWLGADTEEKQATMLTDLITKADDFLRKAYTLISKLESVVATSQAAPEK